MVMNKVRQMISLLSTLPVLTMMSCASPKNEGEQYVPDHLYELKVSYNQEEKAFLFKLTSYADNEICIPRMRWAAENGGHYFFEDRKIYFVNQGIRYDIKDLASGYCASQEKNGCVNFLKKNDQLFGMLKIEDFVVPSDVYTNKNFSPDLQYPYKPRYCASQ